MKGGGLQREGTSACPGTGQDESPKRLLFLSRKESVQDCFSSLATSPTFMAIAAIPLASAAGLDAFPHH
jgi:hypothetical protein